MNTKKQETDQSISIPEKILNSTVTLVPYLLFACLVLIAWPYSMDDAFITFTYSRSLVETGSVTYNGIEVEGYTSFLHMIVAAFLLMLSSKSFLLPLAKLFSIALGFLMISLAGRAVVRLGGTRLGADLCKMAIATSPVLAYHHASALETPLVYVCTLWLLFSLIAVDSRPVGPLLHRILLPLFIGMLARPDFALFVIPTCIYLLGVEQFSFNRLFQGASWTKLVTIFIVGVAYLGWKYLNFGSILPNPFFVKKSVLPTGANFFFDRWIEFCLVAPAVPLACVFFIVGLRRKPIVYIAALSTTLYTFAFFGTNFWQDHYLRYFSPLIPIATIACYAIENQFNKHFRQRLLFLFSMLILIANAAIWPNYVLYTRGMKPDSRAAIGKALADTLPPEALICTGDAGAIPFFSGLANIDIYFLNSSLLTQNRITGTFWGLNTDLVYSQQPDVLILTSSYPDNFLPGEYGNRGLSYEMTRNKSFAAYKRVAAIDASADYPLFNSKSRFNNYRPSKSPKYIYQIFFKEHEKYSKIFTNSLDIHVSDPRVKVWIF